MQEHELQKIIEVIKSSIHFQVDKTVNGELHEIQKYLEKQDNAIKEIHIEQIRVRTEMERIRIETNPLINDRKVITTVGKFVIWIGAICMAILATLKLIK